MSDINNEAKPFKILSIDGGGIKGLYSAKILAHLEEEHGKPMSDYFDLICGTSTGGLIALGLSLKIPASTLVEFYKVSGSKIFSRHNKFSKTLRFIQQLIFRSKYGNRKLKKALVGIFGDKKIGDVNNLLCIPSFNTTLGKNRVFKYDHHHLIGTDNNLSVVDVALATSAAPTYFPIHKIENEYFIDGGVWANNPSLCGLLEGIKYFREKGGSYDSIRILSVSSLNHGSGFQLRKRFYNLNYKRWSFANWGNKLFQTTMDGQSEFCDFFLSSIKNKLEFPVDYVRIPSHNVDHENVSCIDLDKASKRSLEILEAYGKRQGLVFRQDKNVKELFFNTEKTFIINH